MSPPRDALRQAVADAVLAIAPEADLDRLDPQRPMREQLDLDSFDFLRLLVDLQARLGVAVPEADYGRVDTLDRLVDYLLAHGGAAGAAAAAAP